VPPVDRRRQLLLCARKVFARDGYHGASVDDVIRMAAVARGTFYNYFDNKRALFQLVLEELFEEIWSSVRPITIDEGEDVRAQIVGNLVSLCAYLDGNREAPKVLLAGSSGLDPEADQALARFYASCRKRLARALAKGQELGIVGRGDPVTLAICIMGILKEYWTQVLLGTKPPTLERFLGEVHGFFEAGFLKGAGEAGGAARPRKRA
jgi:AcrR family transcriptional regulator